MRPSCCSAEETFPSRPRGAGSLSAASAGRDGGVRGRRWAQSPEMMVKKEQGTSRGFKPSLEVFHSTSFSLRTKV